MRSKTQKNMVVSIRTIIGTKSLFHSLLPILILIVFMSGMDNCIPYGNVLLAQSNIIISGENNATYIHRTEKNVLNNYFENEFIMRLDQRIFSFGMTFKAELPRYDNVEPISYLRPSDIYTEWVDRFIQLNYDNFMVKAGTLEETYGSGLVLRAWNDTENYIDKRLEGAQANFVYKNLRVSGIYGALKEDDPDFTTKKYFKDDLVVAGDIEYRPFSLLNIGVSALEFKKQTKSFWNDFDYYTRFNVFGGRARFITDYFDINAEYSELRRLKDISDRSIGSAIYSMSNVYLGPITLSGGYKRYSRYFYHTGLYEEWDYETSAEYYYPLADLPTLNHYDLLLSTYASLDFEEGFIGELRFMPDFDNEFMINYAETWSKADLGFLRNLFTEYKRNFANFSVKFDFEYLNIGKRMEIEVLDLVTSEDSLEIIPSVYIDLNMFTIPLSFTFSWNYTEDENTNISTDYELITMQIKNKPFIQLDSKINDKLSIAIFAGNEFKNPSEIKDKKVYLGTEITTNISHHTDVTLFVGKEQGGKVCRNGTCQVQPSFEGVRLSLNTRF